MQVGTVRLRLISSIRAISTNTQRRGISNGGVSKKICSATPCGLAKGSQTFHPLSRSYAGTGNLTNLFDTSGFAGIQIRNISEQSGIELEDGWTLRSSCILTSGQVFLWKTPGQPWDGWSKTHFEIFDVLVPKPEILLVGTGESLILPPPSIRQYLHEIGVRMDCMDTRNACSTYNLLSEEGRRVAAALLPLSPSVW
ncbi:hypothetical protein FRC14_007308 [Serendipita sp. 396]|nr:hypothetical protein FRC14_007308 [Serendipita sp. 396]